MKVWSSQFTAGIICAIAAVKGSKHCLEAFEKEQQQNTQRTFWKR